MAQRKSGSSRLSAVNETQSRLASYRQARCTSAPRCRSETSELPTAQPAPVHDTCGDAIGGGGGPIASGVGRLWRVYPNAGPSHPSAQTPLLRQLRRECRRGIISARDRDCFSLSDKVVYGVRVKFENISNIGRNGTADTEQLATLNIKRNVRVFVECSTNHGFHALG